jgi:hypothetical protein
MAIEVEISCEFLIAFSSEKRIIFVMQNNERGGRKRNKPRRTLFS